MRKAEDKDIVKRYYEDKEIVARYYEDQLIWQSVEIPDPAITDFYVSATGDDTNDGSQASPWATIAKVNGVAFSSGVTVNFEGGSTFEGTLEANRAGVTFQSYGTGKATINGGAANGIYSINTPNITIDNLRVVGSGVSTNAGNGIHFVNDQAGNTKIPNITITGTEVTGFKYRGILIEGANVSSGFDNVLIENNLVHEIGREGIVTQGVWDYQKTTYAHSNLILRQNLVHHVYGLSEVTSKHTGSPIMLSDVQHSVVESCTAHTSAMNSNSTAGGAVGIWYWDSDDVVIRDCEAYKISSGLTNKDGAGFDLDGGVTNGIMERNFSHDNDGGGFIIGQFEWARPMANIIVRNNISADDARKYSASMYVFSGETNISGNNYIVNNTFFQTNVKVKTFSKVTWAGGNLGNFTVKNNIFHGQMDALPSGWTAAKNYNHPVDIQVQFMQSNYTARPYNFAPRLAPESEQAPTLDMAENLGTAIVGEFDFNGTPITDTQSLDIGAIQEATIHNSGITLQKRASVAGQLSYGWTPVTGATKYIVTEGGWNSSWAVLPENTFETTETEHTMAAPAGGKYLINVKVVTPEGTGVGRDLYVASGVNKPPQCTITSYDVAAGTAVVSWSDGGGTGAKSLNVSTTLGGATSVVLTTAANSGTHTITGLTEGSVISAYFTMAVDGVTMYGLGDGVWMLGNSWRVPLPA